MNFDYFQIKKWMLQTVKTEKVDEKNGVIYLLSMFPSWVMVRKLSKKKVHFLQFCADLNKKSKSVEAIYTYVSESSHYTFLLFQKMRWFIGVWATIHATLAIKI